MSLINSSIHKEYLANEYKRYTEILTNFYYHIERLFYEYIISLYDRNNNINQITTVVTML